jgi:hypothetical protein
MAREVARPWPSPPDAGGRPGRAGA